MMTINPIMSVDTESNITLNSNTTEMLRVAKDGFYVRGVKVPQDEKEAEAVYKTFYQWLTWAALTRNY
jgi:hypothetical protein